MAGSSDFNTVPDGFTDGEAAAAQEEHGFNEVKSQQRPEWRKILARYTDWVCLIVLIAAIISATVPNEGSQGWTSFVLLIIELNRIVWVGWYSDRNAGNAVKELEALSAPTAYAKRNGEWKEILAREIVPGDVLALKGGDVIPADARLVGEGEPMQIDESSLTGESMAVGKGPGDQYAGMKFKAEGLSIQCCQVYVVQKMHFCTWVDWVYISQSTIPGGGRGIFAARDFEDGEYIGRYLGRLLGRRAEFTDAVLKAYQSPYLLTVRGPGRRGRDIVIDAALPVQRDFEQSDVAGIDLFEQTSWSWPGMFAHLANDGRHGQRVDRCNSQLQARGHLRATKSTPALDCNNPNWTASEILWDYTDGYWREGMEML